MQPNPDWITGPQAWNEFVAHHPELGYKPGKWAFHNFLRYFRESLVKRDAIRRAKNRFWVAHRSRFTRGCFDLATGAARAGGAEERGPCSLPSVSELASGHHVLREAEE